MGLDPLQSYIATTALALPEARTLALAGGGAMIAHGYTDRSTHDIDLFTETDDDEAVRIHRRRRPAGGSGRGGSGRWMVRSLPRRRASSGEYQGRIS